MSILSFKKKIIFHKVRLFSWDYLKVRFDELNSNKIIVIDLTIRPWVKIQVSVENNQINGIADMIVRHLSHCRCKTTIIVKDNSIYCPKCGFKIPFKSTCFKSYLTKKLLKIKNVSAGQALIENNSKHIILIDLDYARRYTNIDTMEFEGAKYEKKKN